MDDGGGVKLKTQPPLQVAILLDLVTIVFRFPTLVRRLFYRYVQGTLPIHLRS